MSGSTAAVVHVLSGMNCGGRIVRLDWGLQTGFHPNRETIFWLPTNPFFIGFEF